jgi:hypothetical protein
MNIRNIFKISVTLAMVFSASFSLAQSKSKPAVKPPAKRSNFAVQDGIRRQALQASAKEWFEKNYLPRVAQVLSPMESYGVSVTEPSVILPPDLGGPLNYIQVVIDARITGWNYSNYRYHGSFSSFPERGWVQCRLQQKLWANINEQGFPVKIMKNQAASSLVACGSSGFFPPEYHGIQRPKFP